MKEGEEPEAKRIKSEPEAEEAEQQASLSQGTGGLFLPELEQEQEEATAGEAAEASTAA